MAAATTILAGASLAVSAGSAVAGADAQRKARNQAADAAKAGKVDIAALDTQTREIAKRNAEESAALEKSMTPEVPQLRTAANLAVLNGLGGNANQQQMANFLTRGFGQPVTTGGLSHTGDFQRTSLNDVPGFQRTNLETTPNLGAANIQTPLLNDAIAKARSDLALGGKLSLEQRNEATRRGAARAGMTSGGLGLGRDLSARDLGLTSYGVEQQRLQNASAIGGQEMSLQQLIESALMNRAGFNLNKNLGEANFNLNQNSNEANYGLSRANFNAGQNAAEANFNLQRNLGEANYGLSRDSLNANNYLNQFGALNSYYNNMRQQDLAAAAYGQSISQPVVGLDPSAAANVAIGNQNNAQAAATNAAGIKAQSGQNWMNFGGQLLGYGMNAYGGGSTSPTVSQPAFGGAGYQFTK